VTPEELERLRRSIVMLSPGQMVSGVKREDALDIIRELQDSRSETKRYREAVAQLRRVLQALERPTA
jgi:hypothetical protein